MNTIAAISTPYASGGIAMIRISGTEAISVADRIFRAANGVKAAKMQGYSCAYGSILRGDDVLDDVVLTVFRAPHSYTGEDTVEITCHGGLYVTKQILQLALRSGAVPAGAGEFTKRAFLNGKISLSQAEAVMDVIRADGETALRQANLAKEGRLGREMRAISDTLVDMMSALAYWLDDAEEFPPELEHDTLIKQLDAISAKLSGLSKRYQDGKVYREGIRTVILGKPNAGKSSVMNWLCGSSRSIVTDIAGTTRDIITEQVKVGDFTLLLSDTAGIRQTENAIEQIGITQAYQELQNADLVLYVVDSAVGLSAEDTDILAQCTDKKVLLLWNKMDLNPVKPPELACPILACAAIHEDSLERLDAELHAFFDASVKFDLPAVMNERQNQLVSEACRTVRHAAETLLQGLELDMIYADLEIAAQLLRQIEGDDITDDVLEGVFSKFCVGK